MNQLKSNKLLLVIILLITVLLTTVSCKKSEPQATYHTSNKNYQVNKLFEHEGCTVYSFVDGREHYYVRCKDREDSIISTFTQSCGKNCTRHLDSEVSTQYNEGIIKW